MRRAAFWLILVALAAVGIWQLTRERPLPVDVAEVTRGPVRSFVEEEGMTRVVERFVVSAPVEGRLLRVRLDEGDPVKKGDLLAEIDPLPLKSRVEETEAKVRALKERVAGVARKKPKPEELDRAKLRVEAAEENTAVAERELEEAKAALVLATKELERVTALARTGDARGEELDAAQAGERQARERVRAFEIRLRVRRMNVAIAEFDRKILETRLHDYDWEERDYREQIAAFQASLKALRDDLGRTRILAPADGVILNLLQESEQVVAPGTALVEVGDLAALEVEADFLSEDVAHMRPGMPAEIFGRALGARVLPARIQRIHPSAFRKISSLGVEQQRVKVIVSLEPGAEGLGDRYRVEVRVILAERADAVLVSEGALFRLKEGWHVFVADGGRARLTPVRTGLRNGLVREVLDGLDAGDRVILHPEDAVEDGTRVRPLPE